MKKIVLISVLFLASCSQITDVANGVGGAAGNSYSPTASATELIAFPAAPPTPFAISVICEQLAKNKTEIRTTFFIY